MVEINEKRRYSEIYQFLLSSEASCLYDEVSESLIQRAIYEANEGANIKDIEHILKNLFNIEEYPEDFVKKIILILKEKENIIESNEKYFLTKQIEKKLEKAVDNYKDIKRDFFDELQKSFIENGLKNISRSRIEKFSYDFLGKLFDKIGSKCAKLRSGKPAPSDPWIKEFNDSINSAIENNFGNNKEKIEKSFIDILQQPSREVSLFLHTLLESYVLSSTLNIDPEMKKLQNADFSKITLYLDTNVLIDLICEKGRCKAIRNILENTKNLGVNVKFTKRTLEEFKAKLDEANNDIKSEDTYKSSNPFIKHYRRGLGTNDWDLYYRKMNNIENFLDGYLIDGIEKLGNEDLLNTDEYSKMYKKVENASMNINIGKMPKSRYPIKHDAYVLLSLKNKIEMSVEYSWIGPSAIFLTNDAFLPDIVVDKGFPFIYQLEEWNEIIHPFISPKSAEKNSEEVYAHLFASKFPQLSGMTDIPPASLIKDVLPKKEYKSISPETLKRILSKEHVIKKLKDYSKAESIENANKTKESLQKIIRKEVKHVIDSDKENKKSVIEGQKRKSQLAFNLLKYTLLLMFGYLLAIISSIAFFEEYTWSIISWGGSASLSLILFIWAGGFINRYSWSEFIDLFNFKKDSK